MERKNHPTRSSITMLIILMLFGFFLTTSALIIVSGADVYKSVTDGMELDSRLRASYAYIANRIRGNESRDGIFSAALSEEGAMGSIDPLPDRETGDMLVLTETYGDDVYYTRIYVWDGWLRESFLWNQTPFSPDDGEKITEVSAFSVTKEEEKIDYSFSLDGEMFFTATACLRGN